MLSHLPALQLPLPLPPSTHLLQVREVRLVRREGRGSVCLVLLRFAAQQAADAFYRDYNGKAVRTAAVLVLLLMLYR
jgi:hypothetical protein